MARIAAGIWNRRLAVGIWPFRTYDGGQDGGLRGPAQKLSQQVDRLFEEAIAGRLVASAGGAASAELNLESVDYLIGVEGGPLDRGEIDVLLFDTRRCLILVIEAKHPDLKLRPADIAATVRNAFVPDGGSSVMDNLSREATTVTAALEAVLQKRGLPADAGWFVSAAIVTPSENPILGWRGPSPFPIVAAENVEGWFANLS